MKDRQTINKVRTVVYASLGFVTGITDLVLTIKPPSGAIPIAIFTEQGNGLYTASYTPTALGVYQETVSSVINGDRVVDAYLCMVADDGDNDSQLHAIQTTLAAMQLTLTQIRNAMNRGGYIN